MKNYDLLVIGGGCAGLSAAISAYKSGIKSIALVEREPLLGGILNQCIHSGFGLERYGEDLTGPEFAKTLIHEFSEINIDTYTSVTVTELSENNAVLSGSGIYFKISFRSVILACGCRETPIGALPVPGTRPTGIFTAGQAQKMINLGKRDIGDDVLILGSGDVGMIVARRLKLLGKNVIAVIEKENTCGGLERNRTNCLEAYNIPLKTGYVITKIYGNPRITGVDVQNLSDGSRSHIPCKTLVTSVGLLPERDLIDNFGNAPLPKSFFFCGNCRTVHNTADAACADGEAVGKAVSAYINTGIRENIPLSTASRRILSGNEVLCTLCPRECILTVKNNVKSGGKCQKFR